MRINGIIIEDGEVGEQGGSEIITLKILDGASVEGAVKLACLLISIVETLDEKNISEKDPLLF
jgi:hypothetical protein